ncbi:enoyl-CoA hydratase/isomerase family protein [Oscillochloris sp. ZM17-4]|uniref:enoyl-CoA hydratase-related protein n=1 Tax=Oscillochloris sp. ZM17-4 TaxID=2866714 RepID=UPI001C73320C|nr:enoyl-CoA hydratase-related protein [Oscillochloris sp. ZM17-4]MBX0329521.1 enoyl-CoA hydratase/isomerase family protein [Oscillochloris sp. ZM17-4]
MSDERLVLTEVSGHIATITLNRPKALNALSPELMDELIAAVEAADADDSIRVLILTGGPKVFAAGADIKAMIESSPMKMHAGGIIAKWDRIRSCAKPIIAAVGGYALGGGCELAMMCDIILASESAQFGQPEINIGVIPGAGGTQRLTRAIGPYRAMELILTGEMISAQEAARYGLVNHVCPAESLMGEARRLAEKIASRPPMAVRMAKDAVRYAAETTLREGLEIEKRNFYMLFDTQDQKEGMRAFIEKRKPEFTGE